MRRSAVGDRLASSRPAGQVDRPGLARPLPTALAPPPTPGTVSPFAGRSPYPVRFAGRLTRPVSDSVVLECP